MTKRKAMVVEYKGTNYSGWQTQKNNSTVSEVLHSAASQILNHDVKFFCSGRTDKGVHALCQVVHFDTTSNISNRNFCLGMSSKLPSDIAVKNCFDVPEDFDARLDVTEKTYCYKMYLSQVKSPLREDTYAQVQKHLDVKKMQEGAQHLLGRHDFSAFVASGGSAKNHVREIYSLQVEQHGSDEIHVTVSANGFLYNMVRIIVGTLVEVGCGKKQASEMAEILQSKDRRRAGFTIESKGLCMSKVQYGAKQSLIEGDLNWRAQPKGKNHE